jgi:hypothetical protein
MSIKSAQPGPQVGFAPPGFQGFFEFLSLIWL